MRRASLTQKILLLLGLPLCCQLIFITILTCLQFQAEAEASRALHAKRIAEGINLITQDVSDLALAGRNFKKLDEDFFRKEYPRVVARIRTHLDDLTFEAKNDAYEAKVVAQSRRGAERALELAEKVKNIYQSGDLLQLTANYKAINQELRASMQQVLSPELVSLHQKLHSVSENSIKIQQRDRRNIYLTLFVFLCFNVLLAVILSLYSVQEIVSRIAIVTENAGRYGARQPLLRPLGDGDEISRLDSVFHEMAKELDLAQRRESAILNNASDLICSIDESSRFIAANPASLDLLGYQPDELIAARCLNFVPNGLVESTRNFLAQCANTHGRQTFETQMLRKDGTAIDTLWSAQWSAPEKAIFCVIHDISERKNLERMKQELVAMITHDLRSPLTAVRHFLEILSSGLVMPLSAPVSKMLRNAESSLERMNALISDLLDLEKIRAGMLELECSHHSVKTLMRRCADDMNEWADAAGVKIDVTGTDFEFLVDEDRMYRVLNNLLSNALKFSPKGSAITLTSSKSLDKAQIKVIDQGRGIPEEKLATIFERYQQVESQDASKKGGSGLGLTICKSIIELHKGTLSVESRVGSGTTFTIELPLQANE